MHQAEVEQEKGTPSMTQIEHLVGFLGSEKLTSKYNEAVSRLIKRHPMTTIKTHSEIYLAKQISKQTSLKVYRSVWIGKFCVDFFIPAIGGELVNGRRKMKGLVIEVNGPVHDYHLKMLKDENRLAVLGTLGIGIAYLENSDINHPLSRKLIAQIKDMPRLGSRDRVRLWSKVRAWTLIANNFINFGGPHE